MAVVVATVQISSLDTNLQLSGLYALAQAVEEVTERDHPLVRPDRSLRLEWWGGKRLWLQLSEGEEGIQERRSYEIKN